MNRQKIKIRQANINDSNKIALVHVKTWQTAYVDILPTEYLTNLSIEKRSERWKKTLSEDTTLNRTYLADLDNKLIGFCSVWTSEEDKVNAKGELGAIYVLEEYQGIGAGKLLMEEGIKYLKSHGIKELQLWVLKDNVKTRKWYVKNGWIEDPELEKQIEIGGVSFSEVCYIITP